MIRLHSHKRTVCYLLMLIWGVFSSYVVEAQENISSKSEVRWIKKIDELFQLGQYSSAAQYIEAVQSQQSPNISEELKETLAFKRLQIGVIENEAFYINKALSFYTYTGNIPNKSQIAFLLSNHYFELSMYKEALDFLESIDQIYLSENQNEQVQFQKAVSYFSEKKFDNAKPYLKSILQIENSRYKSDVQYYLGFISFSENNFDEALPFFQSIEKDTLYSKAIPFYLAYIYHDKGNESKALEYGEEYLKNTDGLHQIEMMQLLASIYFNQDEYIKTAAFYEKLLSEGLSLNPVQRFELGTSFYHLDKVSKSVEQLKALSIGKDDVATEAMFVLGLSYLKMEDKANARTSFQYCTSSNLSPDKKEIAAFLDTKLSFELGFEDQGFNSITAFLDDYPNSKFNQEAREILLQYYTKTNNFKSAFEMLDKVDLSNQVIKNALPRIYYGRAVELIYEVQYDQAEQLLKLLNVFPNSNFYHLSVFWMGEIEFRKNNFAAAAKHFQQYLNNPGYSAGDVNELNALYNLGYCYYELEDYKKGYTNFEKVFLIDNDLSDAKVREAILRAADCYFMDKNFPKAKSLYSKLTESAGFGVDYAIFQLSLIEGMKSPETKISLLKDAVQKFGNSPYISLMNIELADTYMSEENFDEAIPVLKNLISKVDKEDELMPISILKLGIAYFNIDNTQEAIKQYNILIKEFPSSPQTTEALENAKLMFLENGKIDDYQQFLESAGKSISIVEKDSLTYRYIQNAYAIDPSHAILTTLDSYINQYPKGLYITNVLALKADVQLKSKSYLAAAQTFEEIASKGAGPMQEKSIGNAAKLYFNDLKDYTAALRCYQKLNEVSNNPSIQLDALRGVVRSFYNLQNFQESYDWVSKLLNYQSVSKEDSALSYLMLGYTEQIKKEYQKSNNYFITALASSSVSIAAEARFQIANNHFLNENFVDAEKEAISTIESGGSNEKWITKAYILLADLFIVQKDYFNAKATLKSVVEHCKIPALKNEAAEKLKLAEAEEKSTNKKSEKN